MKSDARMEKVPNKVAGIAIKRCAPMVRWTANVAQHGTLDLNGLAMSCYLQGCCDMLEMAVKDRANINRIAENMSL